jgi:hypothetical protein
VTPWTIVVVGTLVVDLVLGKTRRCFGLKRVATPANWHGARTGTGGRKRPIVTRDGREAAVDLLCDRSIVAEPSRMANWR